MRPQADKLLDRLQSSIDVALADLRSAERRCSVGGERRYRRPPQYGGSVTRDTCAVWVAEDELAAAVRSYIRAQDWLIAHGLVSVIGAAA